MFWVRIDNRLVHGQIIEAWLPFIGANNIVVANDDLAADDLRQQIMSIAIPMGVTIAFVPVEQTAAYLRGRDLLGADVLVLLAGCADACRAYKSGLVFDCLNLGNLHYGPGKKQVCQHIALSKDDEGCLKDLAGMGVILDYRCIPSDSVDR